MRKKSFSWSTTFKSILIVDNELFHNTYDVKLSIEPITKDLAEQSSYFERLKYLYTYIFANTVVTYREENLYRILETNTSNRFIELPRPPYDQVMSAVCFKKSNAILDGKIIVKGVELSSYQGDGISYTVEEDSPELELLNVDNWFSNKYNKFNPWWLRGDTATYDKELGKGIYTGHFQWDTDTVTEKKHEDITEHAKIFKFNPRIIDGGKNKNK
jgi:hypothetical protein